MDYIDQARLEEAHGQGDLDATAAEDFIALATLESRLEDARGQEDLDAPAEATNGASEPMPATTQVTRPVVEEWEEVQIDDLVIELESMRAAMYQLEAKNAQLEDKIREEVCEEMMKQMEAMEQAFQVRIED